MEKYPQNVYVHRNVIQENIDENLKGMIEDFKDKQPLISALCNPGLRDRVGEVMTGVVVEVDDRKPHRGQVVVAGPAVEARVEGESPLPLGEELQVRLVEADVTTRRVRFTPA